MKKCNAYKCLYLYLIKINTYTYIFNKWTDRIFIYNYIFMNTINCIYLDF